ncbi:MAG TPA: ribonuclease III [Chthoniobacteraceae bacterium]|nr:ribonuclease III [Chthoniobacteraceae bacterium]
MNPLEERIKYKFRNSLLLAEALTHPSLGHETQRYHFDNQRLEFLGDAVLQLIFTEHLFEKFPDYTEGQLTKLRSRLVSREGLKVHAINIGLGNYMMMGKGEETSGGRARSSALADAFEALIGAMYLDSGLETVRKFVLREAMINIENVKFDTLDVNPKGRLQELLQAISPQSPEYHVVSESGPEHLKKFVSEVRWNGIKLGTGEGQSKKEAEKFAAEDALTQQLWRDGSEASPDGE